MSDSLKLSASHEDKVFSDSLAEARFAVERLALAQAGSSSPTVEGLQSLIMLLTHELGTANCKPTADLDRTGYFSATMKIVNTFEGNLRTLFLLRVWDYWSNRFARLIEDPILRACAA